jgi:ABC-type transporter Mla MlaB component
MIRIETHQAPNHLTLRVEGKLCGVSVAALEDCWKASQLGFPKAHQTIDLSDVTSIDKTGWCLLRRMHRDGVNFSAKGLAVQTIQDELTGEEEGRS